MSDELFVDTNVLVYAFDESEKQKREIAKRIFGEIAKGEKRGVISNQVLGELFFALTQKMENPISGENAQIIVNGLLDSVHWKKINYTAFTISKAIEASIKEKNPFWDTLIAETMIENKIFTILTENTKHFRSTHIKGINPFKH